MVPNSTIAVLCSVSSFGVGFWLLVTDWLGTDASISSTVCVGRSECWLVWANSCWNVECDVASAAQKYTKINLTHGGHVVAMSLPWTISRALSESVQESTGSSPTAAQWTIVLLFLNRPAISKSVATSWTMGRTAGRSSIQTIGCIPEGLRAE